MKPWKRGSPGRLRAVEPWKKLLDQTILAVWLISVRSGRFLKQFIYF